MAYSQDLHQRVLAFYDQGVPTIEVARRLSVSVSWCRRVKQRRDQPRRVVGGSRPRLDEAARAALGRWIDQKPDATLEELRLRISTQLGLVVSIGCLWNTLRRMRLSYKKSR